jgi:cell fate regulator YaaT (PSP1 superfamily)
MTLTDKISENAPDPIIHEVEFKGSRRDYFLCPENISPKSPDYVIVQADRGEHIGRFVRSALRSHFPQVKELKNILRIASYTDVEIMMDNRRKEDEAFEVGLRKIGVHELKMKLVDVEYQFDGNKICFYFTADKRIDFRALVKDLAAEYRTRIELRQIGVRDEARRLGGIGVCGRALCCKTFLGQFEPITSQMARDQNLSLSPSKISGLCGRLMCCLAFEENFYKLRSAVVPEQGMVLEKDGRQFEVVKVENDFFTIRNGDSVEINLGMGEFAAYALIQLGGSPSGEKCGKCCDKDGISCGTPEESPAPEKNSDDIEAIPE